VAAIAAVESAQASLNAAEAKAVVLLAGANPLDLKAAQAGVEAALAGLHSAQAKLDQLKSGARPSEVESAHSALVQAQAALSAKNGPAREAELALALEAVRGAELSVRQAEMDLQGATLVAPFDGVVSALNANVGETPSGSVDKPVVAVVDPAEVRVDATVDEVDVGKLTVGKSAEITFDAVPDRRFRGTVVAVAPSGVLQSGVVTYPISISFNARDVNLPSGLTAAVTIVASQRENVLVVPARAVRRQGRDSVVDVLVNGQPEQRVVRLGLSSDQATEVLEGLQEGDQVLVPGTSTAPVRTQGFGNRPGTLPVPGGRR
jgi:HlyD family secretion protein